MKLKKPEFKLPWLDALPARKLPPDEKCAALLFSLTGQNWDHVSPDERDRYRRALQAALMA